MKPKYSSGGVRRKWCVHLGGPKCTYNQRPQERPLTHPKTIVPVPGRPQPRQGYLEQLGHKGPKEAEPKREAGKHPFLHQLCEEPAT